MGITMPYKPTWQARRTAFGLDGVTPCALEGIVLRNGVLEEVKRATAARAGSPAQAMPQVSSYLET